MTNFDEATAVELSGDKAFAQTHPAYENMVGPFGGVTAATIANAVTSHPQAVGRVAAITVNFTTPLTDGAYTLHLDCVQTNNSNQHWLIKGRQDDQWALSASAVLVSERGQLRATELEFPQVPAPQELDAVVRDDQPAWSTNYEFRFVSGGVDALARGPQDTTESVFWLRHADARPWDYASLVAAADTFFPRSFLRAGRPVPAGTITLTTYVSADAPTLQATQTDVLCSARAQWFGSGMHDQTAHVWSSTGQLLAVSHQLVYSKL